MKRESQPSPCNAATVVADTCHTRATRFGMTREVATYAGRGYALTCRWANKFYDFGLRGIVYESRFTNVAQANAYAVFDVEGAKPWPEDPSPTLGADACRRAGLTVLPPPSTGTLRIVP